MINVNVKAVHFTVRESLNNFIKENVEKLGVFWNQIKDVEVTLTIVSDSGYFDNKFVELKINIPHNPIFAKSVSSSFEKALVLSVEKARKQLKRTKTKLFHHKGDPTFVSK